jgi:hypothetical protein
LRGVKIVISDAHEGLKAAAARGVGLKKTCRKLDFSFFATLGARLGFGDPADPPQPLATLVARPAA